MHSLTDIVVSPEGEREVADTAAHVCAGQILTYPPCGSDKVGGIGIMLLHTCGHSQHIRVEDDVQRIHAHLFCEDTVGSLGYLYTTLVGGRLSLFVETHYHHRGTEPLHVFGMFDEFLFSLLQRDGVDDGLSLHTLQSRHDNLPVGGVDHHGHSGDVGF